MLGDGEIKNSMELVKLTEEESRELMEIRRYEINEKFSEFLKSLQRKIDTYVNDASGDIKRILAMNELFGRTFSQHSAYPLAGYTDLVSTVRDKTMLANNNYQVDGNTLATESSVYLVLEPEDVSMDEDVETLTNNELINRATEIYELEETPYKLYLYINTDRYDLYSAIEEDLKQSLQIEYTTISTFPNLETRSRADLTIEEFPNATMYDILNKFVFVFDVFRDRRKKIYLDIQRREYKDYFNQSEFMMLAQDNLVNHIMEDNMPQPVAKQFTHYWIGSGNGYKYKYEEIEDFFESPSVVQVFGLSPVYGVITDRSITVKGVVVDEEKEEEELIEFEINSIAEVGGVYGTEELEAMLRISSENLRDRLVKFQDNVVRVTSMEKKVFVHGKNLNAPEARIQRYEVKGESLNNIVFLTPYYRGDYYKSLMKYKGAVPYHLPSRFKEYLMRKASSRGVNVPEVDTTWFKRNNRSLVPALDTINEKFDLKKLLGHYITATDGIVRSDITVRLEDIK